MSIKDKILKFTNKSPEKYIIEEMDNLEVYIKSLKGKDLSTISKMTDKIQGTEILFPLIILTVVDEKGKNIFEESDLEILKELPVLCIQKLGSKCMELNGFISSEDKKKN